MLHWIFTEFILLRLAFKSKLSDRRETLSNMIYIENGIETALRLASSDPKEPAISSLRVKFDFGSFILSQQGKVI